MQRLKKGLQDSVFVNVAEASAIQAKRVTAASKKSKVGPAFHPSLSGESYSLKASSYSNQIIVCLRIQERQLLENVMLHLFQRNTIFRKKWPCLDQIK